MHMEALSALIALLAGLTLGVFIGRRLTG